MDQARQRTIEKNFSLFGRGLQTGRNVSMTCFPAPAGKGIEFARTDLVGRDAFKVSGAMLIGGYRRRSALGTGRAGVQTVEHFLAALWGAGIDNIRVEIDGPEIPAMGGSARDFLAALKQAGVKEQDAPRAYVRVKETETVEMDGRSISVSPADDLAVSYLIDYKTPSIGKEEFSASIDPGFFEKEIAPARTFCLRSEAVLLRLMGLGRGANLTNTLVMGRRGPVGARMRFANEPVRHKVLDLIGDLYMLGRPVIGHFRAVKSGHRLNAMMVSLLYEKYVKSGEE